MSCVNGPSFDLKAIRCLVMRRAACSTSSGDAPGASVRVNSTGNEVTTSGNGRDRSSFVFTLPNNHPGALIKALFPFSMRGINISKIESRPSRKKLWDYYFYIDVSGHGEDPEVKAAIDELEQFCPFIKWLGSYPNTRL